MTVGTVPDFAFAGPGVKVDDVVPGSPAEQAGLRKGDVLLRLASQSIEVEIEREGKRTTVTVTVVAR